MSFSSLRLRACSALILCLLLNETLRAADSPSNSSVDRAASSSPYLLLKSMSHAFRTVSYNGRFIYMANSKLRSLRVIHTNLDGREFERLTPLSGGGPEILRKGDELICIHPGGDFMRMDNSIPSGPFANKFSRVDAQIDTVYALVFKGKDRIAGRAAKTYLMQPQDQYRYAYMLWLDNESGLLLKTTLLGDKGQELETFEFVELNVGVDVPQKLFDHAPSSRMDKSLVVNLDGAMSPNSDSDWEAGWLPKGFKMAACDVRHLSTESEKVNALVYSDGMSSFTVFIEPFASNKEHEPMPHSRHGATAVYSHTIDEADDKVMITVVGELPMSAIKKIGVSVVRKK